MQASVSQRDKNDVLKDAIQRFYAKDFVQAAALFEHVVHQDRQCMDALLGLSICKYNQGHLLDALTYVEQAVGIDRRSGKAANHLGVVMHALGRLDEAKDAFKRACRLDPSNPEFWFNAGTLALQQSSLADAERNLVKAVSLRESDPRILRSLGAVRCLRGDFTAAVAHLKQALAIDPKSALTWNDLAVVLSRSSDVNGALAALRRAAEIEPAYVGTWTNLAAVMNQIQNYDGAADAQRRVVDRVKTLEGYLLLADYLGLAGQFPAARKQVALAKETFPQSAGCLAVLWRELLFSLSPVYENQAALIAARQMFASKLDVIDEALSTGKIAPDAGVATAAFPFYLAAQGEDDKQFNTRLGALAQNILKPLQAKIGQAPKHQRRKRDRIRVAVVGSMFRRHTVWKILTRGWLENIDRSCFEMCAYSVAGSSDNETQYAASLFARFEKGQRSLNDWVELIANDRPDVVLFPELGMDPRTWQIANLRFAPVQCVAWGHPVTSGLPTVDYFLSGAAMEPANCEQHYTETLVKLPNLGIYYLPEYFSGARDLSGELPWARQMIAPFVGRIFYWTCQTAHKYQPVDDDLYPSIAEAVPNAMFGFIVPDVHRALFERRLQGAFAARGLRYEDFCLLFPLMSGAKFAAVSSLADVFLDSLQWSGGNTTLENLAFDTPIVAAAGRFMRGRHTAAVLSIAGLDDWVCADKHAYIQRAILMGKEAERGKARKVLSSAKHAVYGDQSAVAALQEFLLKASRSASDAPKR